MYEEINVITCTDKTCTGITQHGSCCLKNRNGVKRVKNAGIDAIRIVSVMRMLAKIASEGLRFEANNFGRAWPVLAI